MLPFVFVVAQAMPVMRGPAAPAAATSAKITLIVMTDDRSLSLTAQSLQPVLDALVKAGADPGSVHLPPQFQRTGRVERCDDRRDGLAPEPPSDAATDGR